MNFFQFGVCVAVYLLVTQFAWVEAVNANDSQTCWSMGQANLKPFTLLNTGFVSFNGNEGYYTMVDNIKLTITVGIRYLNDTPVNCAVYLTNKEAGSSVYMDFCPFARRTANQLTGYSINNTDVALDCSYMIAMYNVTKDPEWRNQVPAQAANSFSAGFKCASIAPSPFLYSIAVRTTFQSADDDMIVLIDTMNSYYMPKVYIYNANVPDPSTVGLCTLDDIPRTPATLSPYISPFPGSNGTLVSPNPSREDSTTRMNAIAACRTVFMNATNWTQLTTYRSLNLKVIIMICTNDYQENGEGTILTNMYSHFFVNELVHQTFYNGSYFTRSSFSDLAYEFYYALCDSYCPTVYNFVCKNNTDCEDALCDFPVECINSSSGYVFETKSYPIIVTEGPETTKRDETTTTTTRA